MDGRDAMSGRQKHARSTVRTAVRREACAEELHRAGQGKRGWKRFPCHLRKERLLTGVLWILFGGERPQHR